MKSEQAKQLMENPIFQQMMADFEQYAKSLIIQGEMGDPTGVALLKAHQMYLHFVESYVFDERADEHTKQQARKYS